MGTCYRTKPLRTPGSSPKGYENCNFGFQELPHGHRLSLWLVWSGTSISLFAHKIPGKLIQAAEFLPLASSNPNGTQMAGTGGQPSILPTEPCLCSKEPGREQITSRSLQKPLPLSPRASSELCPFPGEESHPAWHVERSVPEETQEWICTPSLHNAAVFQLSPPTASGCPLASTAVSLNLKTN